MLWRGATLALVRRGVNVIRGDLREFFFFCGVGTDVIADGGDNPRFSLFEKEDESSGLIEGKSKMTAPIGREKGGGVIKAIGSSR